MLFPPINGSFLFLAYLSSVEANERTPLLQNYIQRLPAPTECNESVGNFYSPMISPEGQYK